MGGKGPGLGEGLGPGLGQGKGPGLGEGPGPGLGEGKGPGKGSGGDGCGEGKGSGLGGEGLGEGKGPSKGEGKGQGKGEADEKKEKKDEATEETTDAKGKDKGKGKDEKGKGKDEKGKGKDEKGKGKGKNGPPKAPPKPKPAPKPGDAKTGKAAPLLKTILPPFGRRFDWQVLSKAKASGTVFSELAGDVTVDSVCLKNLFERAKVALVDATAKAAAKPKEEVVFSGQRAQNMMIALRRQPLTEQVVDALERLDFKHEALGAEVCSILISAVPTAEESKMLTEFPGNKENLREIERQVLPLARLDKPAVGQRLRLLLFGGSMKDLEKDVVRGLTEVQHVLKSAKESSTLRIVLRHMMCLVSELNYGSAVETGSDQLAGFSLDALPKLAQFKATSNAKITLMHILVAQVYAAGQLLPKALLTELAGVRAKDQLAIGPLAESVAAFHREASHAQACLNSRGEKDDEVTTNMRILATDSMRDAAALETSLAATRDLAKSTLSFFAIPYRPQEADPKMLDMINNLCEFIQLFEGCMKDLEAHPSLAKACNRGVTARLQAPPSGKDARKGDEKGVIQQRKNNSMQSTSSPGRKSLKKPTAVVDPQQVEEAPRPEPTPSACPAASSVDLDAASSQSSGEVDAKSKTIANDEAPPRPPPAAEPRADARPTLPAHMCSDERSEVSQSTAAPSPSHSEGAAQSSQTESVFDELHCTWREFADNTTCSHSSEDTKGVTYAAAAVPESS